MLHLEAIEPRALSVLKKLFALRQLEEFYLVGGTALALRYGHRISVDLDIFSTKRFDLKGIASALKKEFGTGFRYKPKPNSIGIFCFIDDVKVDFVRYPHPMIAKVKKVEGIRLYADDDIAAMKVNAILGRGKKKDFWDMSELLRQHTFKEIEGFYYKKYPEQILAISIPHALTYFADADNSEDPVSLKGQTWESVRQHIRQKVREYLE